MDREAGERNIRAHEGLDELPFAHRIINQIALHEIRRHTGTVQSGGPFSPRILDVGCGTGFLLVKMLSEGWEALGVDPFPRGAALREPLKGHVVTGSIDAVSDRLFHVITAIEVLEHIEDYMSLIRDMLNILERNGLLIVTVPNNWQFQAVEASDDTREPKYGHLWRFRPEDLSSDLAAFSDTIEVRPIYSRKLDRRAFHFTRLLPGNAVTRFSQILVDRNHDGAWLMGTAIRGEELIVPEGKEIPTPSARSYRDAEPFSDQ